MGYDNIIVGGDKTRVGGMILMPTQRGVVW